MPALPWVEIVAIFAAGTAAGMVNAVAGGGTLISFPVLVWAGRDPIMANATNSLALWPGALAGAFGFRREIQQTRGLLKVLLVPAAVGGVIGAWLLMVTPQRLFASLVPYLVLLATVVMALRQPLTRALSGVSLSPRARMTALVAAQLVVSIYGGYFGAAIGILMLAALGLYGIEDIHERNGVKGLLGAVTNGVAGLWFVFAHAISWSDALLLGTGATIGGYLGAVVGRRMPKRLAERVVVVIGVLAAVSLFVRQRMS